MCIEKVIFLSFPIGWNEIGVIATVLAVIVALFANRKATEGLKSALEIQEQSKNVGLLDKRIELAESIQSGKTVSELTLQVLFDEEIFQHYKAWRNHVSEGIYAEHDLDVFFLSSRTSDNEGGYLNDVRDTIHKYEADMSKEGCPQQIIDEYQSYCDKHIVWLKTGKKEEMTPYNHAEISNRIAKAANEAKQEQILTLQLIEKFIDASIQQIGKNKKRWKCQ